MELTQYYNYVAFYTDGFKIGRTAHPARRMRQVHAMAYELGKPVSRAVALRTETHIRKVLRRFAIEGTLEYFQSSPEEAIEIVDFTARTQATLEAAGV